MPATRSTFLSPDEWRPVTLSARKQVGADTILLRFRLGHSKQLLVRGWLRACLRCVGITHMDADLLVPRGLNALARTWRCK